MSLAFVGLRVEGHFRAEVSTSAGAKAHRFLASFGTTEVVPFYKASLLRHPAAKGSDIGLKAAFILLALAARLKSCPDTSCQNDRFFRGF